MPYFLVFNLCKKSVQIFAKILSCFILISERVLTLSCSCPVLACPGLSCCGVEAAGLSVCPGGEEERKPPVPPLTLQSSPVLRLSLSYKQISPPPKWYRCCHGSDTDGSGISLLSVIKKVWRKTSASENHPNIYQKFISKVSRDYRD